MRVLIIKTSSMGDIIHTLPALTDAARALPEITFDWVVEESFAEIPTWHTHVDRIIPVALRRWRKNLFCKKTYQEWQLFKEQLRAKSYDLILDAQGLWKSAFVAFFAKGRRAGLDRRSARESWAAFFYQNKHVVKQDQHAVMRARQLFSAALGYALPDTVADYGIRTDLFSHHQASSDAYLVFLHGTTWVSKCWPEEYWVGLAKLAEAQGLTIKMSGGNAEELARAQRIAAACAAVEVLPRLTLLQMANLLANAKVVVAVDTGFAHLAAALNKPTVSLYGPTNPLLTGTLGEHQRSLAAEFPCAPCLGRVCTYQEKLAVTPACFTKLPPERVWREVLQLL